jgi:hypothetical protein
MLFTLFTAVDARPDGSPICHYDKAKVSAAHPEMKLGTQPRRGISFAPGFESLKVAISSYNKLKGFLMYVEDENGVHIGEFKPNPVAKAVKNCYGGLSTITHVDSIEKPFMEFEWIGKYSGKATLVMVWVRGDQSTHFVDRMDFWPSGKKYDAAIASKPTEGPTAGPKADASAASKPSESPIAGPKAAAIAASKPTDSGTAGPKVDAANLGPNSPTAGPKADVANLGPNSPTAGNSAQSASKPKDNAYEEPCEEDPTLPCEEETPTPASETALPAAADEVYSNSAIFANILSLMLLFLQ